MQFSSVQFEIVKQKDQQYQQSKDSFARNQIGVWFWFCRLRGEK